MLAAAGAVLAPGIVRAQAFPSRTIRIVVPVAPGGGVDTFARLIAAKVKQQRDVTFIVENRTGGNSTIGGLEVQRAAPDGYTVLFHASTHNVARLVLKNAPYDPIADFTPIALTGHAPLVLIVANNRPEKTLAEIVAAAKKDPKAWTFATAQLGAPGHLAEVAFNQYAGTSVPIVPYRGTAPAAERRRRRPRPADDRGDPGAAADGARRQRARHRGHRQQAQQARAGDPDHGGGRPAAARFRRLVGHVGTARTCRPSSPGRSTAGSTKR